MTRLEFVKDVMSEIEDSGFEELKNTFTGKYIKFHMIDIESVSKEVLTEKVTDYFEKVEIKTEKSFDKIIERYVSDLDSIVSYRIAKGTKGKKDTVQQTNRARKYYDKAKAIRRARIKSIESLTDYSRLMLCLYMAIIKSDGGSIDDLDYSIDCLELTRILEAMNNEIGIMGKKARFNLEEHYGFDEGTYIILILMFYYINSLAIVGGY